MGSGHAGWRTLSRSPARLRETCKRPAPGWSDGITRERCSEGTDGTRAPVRLLTSPGGLEHIGSGSSCCERCSLGLGCQCWSLVEVDKTHWWSPGAAEESVPEPREVPRGCGAWRSRAIKVATPFCVGIAPAGASALWIDAQSRCSWQSIGATADSADTPLGVSREHWAWRSTEPSRLPHH